VQARTIAETLARCDPDHRELYERNLDVLVDQLAAADQRIEQLLAPFRGRTFYVFHPSLGYFGDRYGLRQEAIEVEGKEPSLRQVGRFIEKARQDAVKVIFVQAQFSRTSAEKIAEAVGATVVSVDPLARDYLANLEALATAFAQALGGSGE
jgi:zinc transport system substrate-binding protein